MNVTTSEIIALGALIVTIIVSLTNGRRGAKTDAADQARQNAELSVKLDSAISGISDIRVDIRGLKNDLAAQGQELARVEASTESAHKRIDELEKLFHKAHPPV